MKTDIMKINKEATMSSLEIAELTGKAHKNVLRKCRELFDKDIIRSAQIELIDSSNRSQPAFNLNKTKNCQCMPYQEGD